VPLFGVGDEEKRRLSEDNRRFEFYGGHRPPLQTYMCEMMFVPNSLHLISVPPSISRAKS
jgi:hypothetical protein